MWCQKMFYLRNNIYNKSIPTSQKTSEFQLFFDTKKPKKRKTNQILYFSKVGIPPCKNP